MVWKYEQPDNGDIIFRYFKYAGRAREIWKSFREENFLVAYAHVCRVIRSAGLPLIRGGDRHHGEGFQPLVKRDLEKRASDLFLLIGNNAPWGTEILRRENIDVGKAMLSRVWKARYGNQVSKNPYIIQPAMQSLIVQVYEEEGRSFPALMDWIDEWRIPYTPGLIRKFLASKEYNINRFN